MLRVFILFFFGDLLASISLDLTPGNFWDGTLKHEWENAFIDKLKDMAARYEIKFWYDIMDGPHIYLPHLSPLWHLQLPMEAVYKYDPNGHHEKEWKAQKDVFTARNLEETFRLERVRSVSIPKHLQTSLGHLLITPHDPAEWEFENDWTYKLGWPRYPGAPYYHQAYSMPHVDEENIYFGDEPPGQWVPLNFANYFRANQYKAGPVSKDDLIEAAGFSDRAKPLLVYLSSYDDWLGPDSDTVLGKRPFSVLFAQSEKLKQRSALFDLGELDKLTETYNVVLRIHPFCADEVASQSVLTQLADMDEKSDSLFVDIVTNSSADCVQCTIRFAYTDWYEPADVLVVEVGATSAAAMVLASDKPIVFARRLENDEKLQKRGHKLITDQMVAAWRPEQNESLLDAVSQAQRQMAESTSARTDIIKARKQYNEVLYRCPLNGYEEYATMLSFLSRIWLGYKYTQEFHELKKLYLRDEFEWCDVLPRGGSDIIGLLPSWYLPFSAVMAVLISLTCSLHFLRSERPAAGHFSRSFVSKRSSAISSNVQLASVMSPPP